MNNQFVIVIIIFVFRKYIVAFVTCPIIFYIPKFFEVRSFVPSHNATLNCTNMFMSDMGVKLSFVKTNEAKLKPGIMIFL